MSVEWSAPVFLWLLPVMVALVVFLGRRGGFGSRSRRAVGMVLRCMVCACLVLALSGMSLRREIRQSTTVFAVDLSDSLEGTQETAAKLVSGAATASDEKHNMGLVCFGQTAMVERNPTDSLTVSGFSSLVDARGSDLSAALEKSGALLNRDGKKRVVLFSDGQETTGDAVSAARLLAAAGVTVDVWPMERELGDEVQMTAIHLPQQVNRNTSYAIELELESASDQEAWIRLYKGTQLIVNEAATLRTGTNRLRYSDVTETGGSLVYRAEVTAGADSIAENNQAYAYCNVTDVPQVLILETDGSGSQLGSLLEGAGLSVTRAQAGDAPVAADRLAAYDAVVLANVAYNALPKGFADALEAYVRVTGGGLLVTGGENAYALGGYYGTVLEDILPVSMDLRTQDEDADLGMVFVLDRSGSMTEAQYGISKLEMAKEAVIRALDSLNDYDSVGLVTFDDAYEWTVPLQKVGGNLSGIQEAVGGVQPGGGTSILPGLTAAYNALQQADCRIKHIILLTDGQAEQTGYDSLIRGMKNDGITLSTVAVGSGADTALLGGLAEKAGGRYYFTNEFTDLPEIFAREALLAGREYINNREFYPEVTADSQLLTGIEALPKLSGYIGTMLKPRGEQVLQSDQEEPVLAAWRYGLGQTVAWTSDAAGQWTAGLLASAEGQQLFRNMVSYVLRTPENGDVQITAQTSGGESDLTVTMEYDAAIKSLSATVLSSDNQAYEVALSAAAPGVYTGKLPTAAQGVYVTTLQAEREDGTETMRSAFVLGYPQEYDIRNRESGRALLEKVAAAGGGRVLDDPQQLTVDPTTAAYAYRDFAQTLLLLAVLLFLLDVALRRFPAWLDRLDRSGRPRREKVKPEPLPLPVSPAVQPKPVAPPPKQVPPQAEKASISDTLLQNKRRRGK